MIVYASIARVRDGAVLVEVTSTDYNRCNAGFVMTSLIQHLKDHPELLDEGQRKTFIQKNETETDFFSHFIEVCAVAIGDDNEDGENEMQEHYFHLTRKDNVFYCCLGDDPDPRDQKVNFAFLEHLQEEFVKMYRPWRINTANAYAFQKNFSPSLRSAMHYHNINHKQLSRDKKVQSLLSQVDDFKSVMGRNINILMQNQQHISSLMIMSEDMQQDAQIFKKRSTQLKRKEQSKWLFVSLCSCGVVMILIYITVVCVCGPRLEYCHASSNGGGGSNYNNENNKADNGGGGRYV